MNILLYILLAILAIYLIGQIIITTPIYWLALEDLFKSFLPRKKNKNGR